MMANKYVPQVGDVVKVRDDADSYSVGAFYNRGDVGVVKETDGDGDTWVLFDHGQWCVAPDEIELVPGPEAQRRAQPDLDDVIKQRDRLLAALQECLPSVDWRIKAHDSHSLEPSETIDALREVAEFAREAIALAEVAR